MSVSVPMLLLAILASFVMGFLFSLVFQRRKVLQLTTEHMLENQRLNLQCQREEEKKQDAVQRYSELQREYSALSQVHANLQTEYIALQTTLDNKTLYFEQQQQQLQESQQYLRKEFESLANRIFEEKGKTFTHSTQTTLDHLLKPFREQITAFQQRVNEVHDAALKGNTVLHTEIKKVLETGIQMSQEAQSLTTALKGSSQQRGAWGEAQLQRTLEMSGLIANAHYEAQSAFKDRSGNRKQLDYLIKLPDGKHLIIDSKVSLNAYHRVVTASSPKETQLAMDDYSSGVRKHIDDLASKDYTGLLGIDSPSFVLMFMPIEPAYIEVLKHNPDLFEYAYAKGIVLVSHTTLIPILRTIANLWMVERSTTEAKEISEKAGDIYNQVAVVAEHMSKLGGTLQSASNHYNRAVRSLVGKQGLYGKVERFNQLSIKVSKVLPTMETSHVDFETERLSLMTEEIHDHQIDEEKGSREIHEISHF